MTTRLEYVDTIDATCSHDTCATRGTYRLNGHCTNCDWNGAVIYTRGHQSSKVECPCCGCKTVQRVTFQDVDHG